MNEENELNFLCDVLEKCHVNTSMLSPFDNAEMMMDSRLVNVIGFYAKPETTIRQAIGDIDDHTKYKFVNEFKLRYICVKLPVMREKNLLFIGPYLSDPMEVKDVLEIAERAGISSDGQKHLTEYYAAVPVVAENDRLFAMIDTFCERIWHTPSFAIVESNKEYTLPVSPINRVSHADGFDETLANVEMMEMRYAFENELIQAVALGQRHKEKLFLSVFNEGMFGRRIQDPVRNAKNYCIIMNTLLRKAAEQGGVHPIYIDRVSSDFAAKIELIVSVKAVPDLMREMFSSYSSLVYKHSMKKYSQVVKRTILVIESDISAELSLRTLAHIQGISAGYLATIFKKETGQTISEYIRDKRIKHAMYLLSTTHLQVQTIALHCGIVDVQYFSKQFKKQTGKTPREYRESIRTGK